MLEKSDLQTGQIFLDFDKFLIPGYAVSDIWIQEGSATAAVHQFKVLTYYSHCHGSVKVLDRKVFFAENLSYMKTQESSDSFERAPDYFTYRDSWFCHVTSSTEYTESMQFHQKVTSQNTHAVTMGGDTAVSVPHSSECWERKVTTRGLSSVFPLNISGPNISSPLNINANI